jgi:type III secretion system YscD/HrpQ family protein
MYEINMTSQIYEPISARLRGLELRVLLGAQAGAALPLSGDHAVIGSGRQCDVILQGPGVALQHANLTIAADGFSLSALDGEITAATDAAAAPPWRFGTTVYLGGVGVTIDHGSAEWLSAAPPQAPAPSDRTGNTPQWHAGLSRRWRHLALLTAVLISLSIGAQLIWAGRSEAAVGHALSPADMDALKTLIARHGRDAALTLDATSKKTVVRGYLPTVRQVNLLRKDLYEWRRNLVIDVHADDALLAAGRHFLIRERSPLKIAVTAGQALLSGLDAQTEDVKRLAQDIKKALPGLAGVNATFVDRQRLESWLRLWRKDLAANGRDAGPVSIDATAEGDLALHGTLAPQQIEDLRNALTRRSLQKNMLLALRINVAASPEPSRQMPAVRAFSTGAVPYVFLANGRRVMIGGAVEGFHLVAINRAGPVFEKQGG